MKWVCNTDILVGGLNLEVCVYIYLQITYLTRRSSVTSVWRTVTSIRRTVAWSATTMTAASVSTPRSSISTWWSWSTITLLKYFETHNYQKIFLISEVLKLYSFIYSKWYMHNFLPPPLFFFFPPPNNLLKKPKNNGFASPSCGMERRRITATDNVKVLIFISTENTFNDSLIFSIRCVL